MKKHTTEKALLSLLVASPMVLCFSTITANAATATTSPVFVERSEFNRTVCSNKDELTGKVVMGTHERYQSLLNNEGIITQLYLEDEDKGIYYGRTASPINGVSIGAYYNAKTDAFYDVEADLEVRSCSGFNQYHSLPAIDQFGNNYKVTQISTRFDSVYRKDGSLTDGESFAESLSVELNEKALRNYTKQGLNLTLRTTLKDPLATPEQLVVIPPYLLQGTLDDFRSAGQNLKDYYKEQGKKW